MPRHADDPALGVESVSTGDGLVIRVRRIHRRDLNRTWEFLKLVFRDVNRETVEYQRPRSKKRFLEVYEEEGVEQLVFEVTTPDGDLIVGYAECTFEIFGEDNWMNERYFANRDMRPLFVEELAVHPGYQGQGIGGFILEQLDHLAKIRGCTHLVLEVAENNESALHFYKARSFFKMDAAIFMAKKVNVGSDLLPPRKLRKARSDDDSKASATKAGAAKTGARKAGTTKNGAQAGPSKKSAARRPPPRSKDGGGS